MNRSLSVQSHCPLTAMIVGVGHHPDRWGFYVWDNLEHIAGPTIEQKIHSLEMDNPRWTPYRL